jgi:hypothetical protein
MSCIPLKIIAIYATCILVSLKMLSRQDTMETQFDVQGKKQGKADVFYYLKNAQSMRVLSKGLEAFNKEIDNIEREEESDDE